VRALRSPPPATARRQLAMLAAVGITGLALETAATADFVDVLRAWLMR
jgi:hypothetical protein